MSKAGRKILPTPPEGYVFCPTCEQTATEAQMAPEGVCVACIAEFRNSLPNIVILRSPPSVRHGAGEGEVPEQHLVRVKQYLGNRAEQLRTTIDAQTRELLAKRKAELAEERVERRSEDERKARIEQAERSAANLREALAREEQVLREAEAPVEKRPEARAGRRR